jgi:ribonuclease-3
MQYELQARLGTQIKPHLLELALTHASYAFENRVPSNERLEFLGDSILGFVVANAVFRAHPTLQEGDLTRLKNSIISAEALATAANRLELGNFLKLGKGEHATGGRRRLNILADAMEAIIAASYLTSGLEGARAVVERHLLPLLGDPLALRESADPKTTLAEKLSRLNRSAPHFEVAFSGPEHARQYLAKCFCDNQLLGEGEGRTIRSAETASAIQALAKLGGL